ncbi:transposase family protein [Streptosporangium sp. CA-135522]|uniref:transposase family protein n=1 Tax=Streptosporangium sp. CA-135522 TaxID=3240072 RepID=UPI003D8A9DEA
MKIALNRAALAHQALTGVSLKHLGDLVVELARPWQAMVEGRRHMVRGGERRRAAGAGARHRLVFADRVIATLIYLRHDLPHAVLGVLFAVDRSTITRAVGEIRTLLAARGFAVPQHNGLRLRTLADVFAYAHAERVVLRLDATEVQVRRPTGHRGGRRAFVSGKKKMNTMKATVVADEHGRTLWAGAIRPGRMHDVTAARSEGIDDLFSLFPDVRVLLDEGYPGLRRDHPRQAVTPPRKPGKIAAPEVHAARELARHRHSSLRIPVENAIADHKRWKGLTCWTHRRDTLPATYLAIAGLVSDRATDR